MNRHNFSFPDPPDGSRVRRLRQAGGVAPIRESGSATIDRLAGASSS